MQIQHWRLLALSGFLLGGPRFQAPQVIEIGPSLLSASLLSRPADQLTLASLLTRTPIVRAMTPEEQKAFRDPTPLRSVDSTPRWRDAVVAIPASGREMIDQMIAQDEKGGVEPQIMSPDEVSLPPRVVDRSPSIKPLRRFA